MPLVTRADLDRCLAKSRAYHTGSLPSAAYHTDPACVWGTRIEQKHLQPGFGRDRHICPECRKWAKQESKVAPAAARIPRRDLQRLADLMRTRNAHEVSFVREIGRPAILGHIAEHIAARIFDIHLHEQADHPASDGIFQSGRR